MASATFSSDTRVPGFAAATLACSPQPKLNSDDVAMSPDRTTSEIVKQAVERYFEVGWYQPAPMMLKSRTRQIDTAKSGYHDERPRCGDVR
jgi:hypothetical protein